MKKGILIGLFSIVIIAAIAIFYELGPSNDITNYKQYFTNDTHQPSGNQVKVTFFGVSTLLFDDGETQLLIDGFFSRPSFYQALFTDIESNTALIDKSVSSYKMNRVKGIFVAHSHYDHAFDVAYTTKKTHAILYGSLSTLNIARGGGVKEAQLALYQLFKNIQLGKFTVQVIPSKHSPGNALNDDGVIIDEPLGQPASMKAYSEGGSFDFSIQHNGRTIYVKASPNYIEGALDSLRADVVFLGIGTVGERPKAFQDSYYEQTIGKLKPALVIPLHWDNFFQPLSENLVMLPRFANGKGNDFDVFIKKTKADKVDFKILQGTKSIVLFNP